MKNDDDFGLSQADVKYYQKKIWLVFIGVFTALMLAIFFLLDFFEISYILNISIVISTWFVVMITTLILGLFSTPQMHEDIVEIFGKYIGRPLGPGLHLRFPYFNIEVIAARVYMGEQKLPLRLDEKEGNKGDVEFQDCSAPLQGNFFFKVFSSRQAYYNVANLIGVLEEKAEHVVRGFFGVYLLDEAIAMKSIFKLENVVAFLDLSKDSPYLAHKGFTDENGDIKKKLSPDEMRNLVVSEEEFQDTRFYKDLNNWGVLPKSFTITDIDIPADIKAQRSRVLEAEKDREVAKIRVKTAELDAESVEKKAVGEAKRIEIEGAGLAKKIKLEGEAIGVGIKDVIESTKLDPLDASNHLIARLKWAAIKENPNITLIDESSGETSKGFKVGLGFAAAEKKKNKKK